MTDSVQNSNNYKNILKGSSVFGGVQIFLILINIIRGKFVAVFLGPEGMGISSLFTSSSNTLIKTSSLGLNLAIVKEIAQNNDDINKFQNVICVIFKLLHITAIMGALICVIFSSQLSELTFNTRDYAWQFIMLSAAVFFSIAGNAKLSILQGLHEVRKIAKATLIGALTGLFAGVPLYCFFNNKGIVPAIIILSFTTYVFYSWNTRNLHSRKSFSWNTHKHIIKRLIGLGIVLLAGDLIGTICTYMINIYLRSEGDIDTVGLYQAANSITNQYSGAIFAALALDYFPRLSKSANDNIEMTTIVNRQSEIVALTISPLAILVILTAPVIIKLLLTNAFLPILELIRWLGLGIMLRALQFPMGYITFAKDNKKLFFILEGLITNFLYLVGSIIGFHYFGLIGLGYAMIIENILSIFIYYSVNYYKYNYKFSINVIREYLICVLLCYTCFVISFVNNNMLSYSGMSIVFLISLIYSIKRIVSLIRTN